MLALAAVIAAAAVVAVVLLGTGPDYRLHIRFTNASQLVKGNLVQVAGVKIGSVQEIELGDDGQAIVTVGIDDDDYVPLREGTLATVRQASLSGVANRYIDLQLPDGRRQRTLPDGGTIASADTTSAVDLDQLFNTIDPKTRRSLQGVIKGFARSYDRDTDAANAGWQYLDPSLVASDRLFAELNRDTPLLRRFIDASSRLVTDVAARRDDLAGVVDHLATTTGALGRQKVALASAIGRLPDFMRRADTTFANLRATLDDLRPLVEDSKPAVRALRPFVAALRPLAQDARPTVAAFAALLRRQGADNDLLDLVRGNVPLRDVAVGPVTVNGKEREGALPASVRALGTATPELAFARPYAVDLTGWFDDFSHSGIYDALGGASRAAPYVNGFTNVNGILKPVLPEDAAAVFDAGASLNNTNRCPGSAERGSAWKPTPDYNCDLSQVPLGP
jgi:phospholipid/cholesterol/gamma-HCH transport system substrate-binding protein